MLLLCCTSPCSIPASPLAQISATKSPNLPHVSRRICNQSCPEAHGLLCAASSLTRNFHSVAANDPKAQLLPVRRAFASLTGDPICFAESRPCSIHSLTGAALLHCCSCRIVEPSPPSLCNFTAPKSLHRRYAQLTISPCSSLSDSAHPSPVADQNSSWSLQRFPTPPSSNSLPCDAALALPSISGINLSAGVNLSRRLTLCNGKNEETDCKENGTGWMLFWKE